MTDKPVIILLEPIHDDGASILRQEAQLIELDSPSDPRLMDALRRCEGIIVRSTRIDASMLAAAPMLRVIGRHGAGIDNIDLEAASARGIRVVNTPSSNTNSVAEYVIAVIFALTKRISEAESALRNGVFSTEAGSLPGQVQRLGFEGRDIAGAHLGLIGAGAIGQSVARKAQALGMRVSAVDPYLPEHVWEKSGLIRVAMIDDLLPQIDILSVHVPGGNTPLVTADLLALLPPHAIVVNAARGGVIDEGALAQALAEDRIAGAAIDVHSSEPPRTDSPLMSAPRVLATPHMAAVTTESLKNMAVDVARFTLDALSSVNEELTPNADKPKGYSS